MLKKITSQKLAEQKLSKLAKTKKLQCPVTQKTVVVSKPVNVTSHKFNEAKSQCLQQCKLDIKA